jgi:hypothetical protein
MSTGNVIKPELIIKDDRDLPNEKKEVATYSPKNKTIIIGMSFLELTRKFGKDSTTARAHVLSHELAHLFLNHGYAAIIGTGFASKELNKEYKKTKEEFDERIAEMEADQWASFYAYIAGYKTNSIAPKLLDSIYKYYNLSDKLLSKYPTLNERKKYAVYASFKMNSMCEAFDFANISNLHGDFTISRKIYEAIIEEGFKSREIVSNLGAVYLMKAISLMDTTELKYILPIQIDMNTRMKQTTVRSLVTDAEIKELLNSSIEKFKLATTIDPNYTVGYLNLSIANWLLKDQGETDYFLNKAKKLTSSSEDKNVRLFESIMNFNSSDAKKKDEGLSEIKKLSSEGYNLASINLNLIEGKNKINNKQTPDWILNLSNKKLSESTENSLNILDSTFQKDKYRSLSCKEVKEQKIIRRKWKSIGEPLSIVYQYFIQDNPKNTINELEKKSLYLNCQAAFEYNNNSYLRFDDVIVIIDRDNSIKCQIIKSKD